MEKPLQIRDDGLWARVSFTDRAADAIRSRELLFTSATWKRNAKDRVTGETLPIVMGPIALTNLPFIDGLEPLALADGETSAWVHIAKEGLWKGHDMGEFEITNEDFEQAIAAQLRNRTPLVVDYDHESLINTAAPAAGWVCAQPKNNGANVDATELVAAIAELLGLPKDAGPEEIKSAVEGAAKLAAAQKGDAGKPKDAPSDAKETVVANSMNGAPDGAPVEVAGSEVMQILQDISGLDAAGVLAALKEHQTEIGNIMKSVGGNGSPAGDGQPIANSQNFKDMLALTQKQVSQLAAKVQTYEAAEFEREFEDTLKAGRATLDMKETLQRVWKNSREDFKACTANQIVPMSAQATAGTPKATTETLSRAQELAVETLKNINPGMTDEQARSRALKWS